MATERAYGYKAAAGLVKYRGVVLDGNGKLAYPTTDGDKIFGLTTDDVTSGKVGNAQRSGQAYAEVSEALSAGDLLRALKTTGKLEKAEATATLNSTNANADLTFTAQHKFQGGDGDEISVELKDPSGNNKSLSITVNGKQITVSLATDGSGAITSTAAQIKTAIDGDADASDLVSVAVEGDGSGVVDAIAQTFLSGGNGAFCTALEAATADGDIIRVDIGGVA